MVQYHTLVFVLVTVTFAISEARTGRRNYNVNTNINQNVNSGYNGRPSRENVPDRVQYYPHPQESFSKESDFRDRPESYDMLKYPYDEPEFEDVEHGDTIEFGSEHNYPEWDYLPNEDFDNENSQPEYYIDMIKNDGTYGGQICRDGSYHPALKNRLADSIKSGRESGRSSELQAYPRNWDGPPPINTEPEFRGNNNWGHLSSPNVYLRRPRPIPAIRPNSIRDRQPYVVKRPVSQSLDIRPYQTMDNRLVKDEFEATKEPLVSNMNSNTNINVMTRRNNANANINTNIIGHGGYGPSNHNRGSGRESQSYPSYAPQNYSPGGQASSFIRPSSLRRPKTGFPGQWQRPDVENKYGDGNNLPGMPVGDEYDNNDGYMEYGFGRGSGNANVNTNANININSRRMKPRSRRNVKHHPGKTFVTPQLSQDATTKVVAEGSSTTGQP